MTGGIKVSTTAHIVIYDSRHRDRERHTERERERETHTDTHL